MKSLFTILSIAFSFVSQATIYYVGAGGNDAATGTSVAQRWLSLGKVSTTAFLPGDQILFASGEIWNGKLEITSSGTFGNPIKYGFYGTGTHPKLSGFTTVTTWTSLGGNIYRASVSNAGEMIHVLTVNGVQRAKGRFPRLTPGYGGFWTNTSVGTYAATSTLTSTNLSGRDYSGGKAQAIMRLGHEKMVRQNITAHSGSSITLASSVFFEAGNGFFVQNHPSTLTAQNDWMYDPAAGYLYIYLNSAPSNYVIQVSNAANNLLNLYDKRFVTIEGLGFEGCNGNAITLDAHYGPAGITVRNCEVRFAAGMAINPINADSSSSSAGFLIENNIIEDCESGIVSFNWLHHSTIRYNTLTRMGMLPGNGLTGSGGGGIAASVANHVEIYGNRLDYLGYSGIVLNGSYQNVYWNLITNGDQILDDGGAIYSQRRGTDWASFGPVYIYNNFALNFPGNGNGIANGEAWGDLFYLDDLNTNVYVLNNGGANAGRHGLYFHTNKKITAYGNTIFNCSRQLTVEPNAAEFATFYSTEFTIKKNTLVLGNSYQRLVLIRSDNGPDNRGLLGIVDSNFYYQPTLTDATFHTSYKDGSNNLQEQFLTFTGWKSLAGANYDSHGTNTVFTADANTRFEYNETSSPKIISLTAKYAGVTGTPYNSGTITLQPYTAAVLRKTGELDVVVNPPASNGIQKQRRRYSVKVISMP
jgi:hypothetical protein